MGEDIEGECRICQEPVVIDSTSLGFIASAAGWDREEALLCDEHLNAELEGLTLDLSIGADHTRSQRFERQQQERSMFSDGGEDEELPPDVTIYDPYYDDNRGEYRAKLDATGRVGEDVKKLSKRTTGRIWSTEHNTWTVLLSVADRAKTKLEDAGWRVEIEPEVRAKRADVYSPDDRE